MRYLLLVLLLSAPTARAVPVIQQFNSGSTSARTESKQNTTEIIESWTYSTGYDYSINGTNLSITGDMLPETVKTGSHTVDGVTTSHYGINLNTKPTVNMHTQGAATQMLESYQGPGLKAFTRINRNIITESVTDTMSTFSGN
tara:strand:- start:1673 stop:2101 length:429 start_codon:yes stop_codon:yes gene_type:complete